MRSLVVLFALTCFSEARPSFNDVAGPSFSMQPFVVGGVEATPGEFPWQLSLQRQGTSGWSHNCGASLLSAKYALSAAHCVDGASVSIMRIIAGLHNRTAVQDGVLSNILSYKMHERYNTGQGTYPNDIAILTLATEIPANGANIQYASLPDNNNDQFAGRTCVISGWGYTSSSFVLPQLLQKASINIITTAECNAYLRPASSTAVATDNHVCLYDTDQKIGSCGGDSGSPLNCNYPAASDERRVVFGVTSWGIAFSNVCQQAYPSVYTRVAPYLDWIATNTA